MNELMHCGAQYVEREALSLVPVPPATPSYQPIPHSEFVEKVRFTLGEHGYRIGAEKHALTREGARYFGTINLVNSAAEKDFCWVVGLRNSHDKSFPAGLVAGSRVFVCDNLSFTGEIKVARKHTTHLLRDLPRLTSDAISRLHDIWTKQEERYEVYKATELSDTQVNDLIIRNLEFGVIPSRDVLDVVKEWKQPSHDFGGRTAWTLFNAFTGILKDSSPFTLDARTRGLHHVLDSYLKFSNN